MKTIPRLFVLLSIILILATTGLAQTPPPPPPAPSGGIPGGIPVNAWQEFKHEAGNFVVTMPGKPLEMSQTIESEIGKVPTKSFIANLGRISFMAMYADYPIAFDTPEAIKNGLDGSRDMILSKGRAKLISEKEILFKKYPGREITARIDLGIVRLRVYLVHQRFYMLMVASQDANDTKQLESEQAGRFLDSFQLIEDPKGAPANIASISRFESAFENIDLPPDFANRPISWREVPSPEFGFTIWMPSEPFRKKIPLNPNDQRLDIQLWMARSESGVCQLMVQPFLSAPSDEATRGVLFKNLLEGVVGSGEMKLESEKAISLEGYSGREYKMSMDSGVALGRAYIIGSNLYLMLGIADKDKKGSAEIARFFDSFRLTKKPDPAPATGAVSPGSTPWREFSEPGHGFKVALPGEPKKETSYSSGVMSYILLSAGDGITCLVTRQRLPLEPVSQPQIDSFYKSFIRSFAESARIEITGEANIVVVGRQGREYGLKRGENTGAIRIFLDGRDVYAISAIRLLPEVDPKSITSFFDSFKLIEKSPKDEFAEPPPPPMAPARKAEGREGTVKISGGPILDKAIKKVAPDYPPIARAAGAEGKVIVSITTSAEGKVIEATFIEGHPLLRDSVLRAAKQWEFKPAELSGVPAKVQDVLTFHFTLK
jgi:TonB family protein